MAVLQWHDFPSLPFKDQTEFVSQDVKGFP